MSKDTFFRFQAGADGNEVSGSTSNLVPEGVEPAAQINQHSTQEVMRVQMPAASSGIEALKAELEELQAAGVIPADE